MEEAENWSKEGQPAVEVANKEEQRKKKKNIRCSICPYLILNGRRIMRVK